MSKNKETAKQFLAFFKTPAIARQMEAANRTSLAKGEVGIREKKLAPSLADFLKNDFAPFVKAKHATKPRTAEYYADGANMVGKCDWISEPLDKISDQHAQHLAAKYAALSASRIKLWPSQPSPRTQSGFRVGQARNDP